MNLIDKLITPLINNNITLQDLSEKTGFVKMCTTDINRPYLDNHIFLLYETKVNTVEACDRIEKLSNLDNLYDTYFIKINGKSYTLYCFTIANKAIRKLESDSISLSDDDLMHIIKFWNFTDNDINKFMLHPSEPNNLCKFCNTSVPEEDYEKELIPVFDKKSQAIHMESLA